MPSSVVRSGWTTHDWYASRRNWRQRLVAGQRTSAIPFTGRASRVSAGPRPQRAARFQPDAQVRATRGQAAAWLLLTACSSMSPAERSIHRQRRSESGDERMGRSCGDTDSGVRPDGGRGRSRQVLCEVGGITHDQSRVSLRVPNRLQPRDANNTQPSDTHKKKSSATHCQLLPLLFQEGMMLRQQSLRFYPTRLLSPAGV